MKIIEKFKSNPWLIAGAITLLVVLWMMSGAFSAEPAEEQQAAGAPGRTGPQGRVADQRAELVDRVIDVYGRTEPARLVTLKAETGGRVVAVPAAEGSYVEAGGDLVVLDVRDREAQLARARAEAESARLSYEAEKQLKNESYVSETRLAAARAQYEAARAELRRLEVDLANTRIRAPFNGALRERLVEVGDYVAAGDPVAVFVDIDTLIVSGRITETERANLVPGSTAIAELVTGERVEGRIRYIAPVADEATRTFRVELEVPNPERSLPAGITAQVHVPAGQTFAHRISPSILALDENGEIGIKTVAEDGTVRFNRIEVVKSTNNGMWIAGLPEAARIITVGQGFVKPGDKVRTVRDETSGFAIAVGSTVAPAQGD